MNKQQFNQIIKLQREKMKNIVRDSIVIFMSSCNELNKEENQFILNFIEYLKKKIEDDIKEWDRISAWELGWSKKDVFYQLNYKPLFPLIYKHYFDVPEKDVRKFKKTYKDLSKFLFNKYPYLHIWRKQFSKYYNTYRRKLIAKFLNSVLYYGDSDNTTPIKGIPTSVVADLISSMRTFKKMPMREKRNKLIIEKLKKGEKEINVASDLGISVSTVSRIKSLEEKNG